MNIAITGASGWMGRSAILACRQSFPSEKIKLHSFSSVKKQFSLHTQEIHNSQPLAKIVSLINEPIDLFLPFAFLTQDKVTNLGVIKYEKANSDILNLTMNFIEKNRPSRVINLSSGVVSQISEKQMATGTYDVYRKCKKIQEEKLEELCTKLSIPIVTCRIFSVTGIEIQDPGRYAFGDLLIQASKGIEVVIKSNALVNRRYIDAVDLICVLMKVAKDDLSCKFESGGVKVEIRELTRIIQDQLGLPVQMQSSNLGHFTEQDDYFSQSYETEKIASKYGINLKTLNQQIENTLLAPTIKSQVNL